MASALPMLMVFAKVSLILIAALGISVVMKRASAGARHLVWLVTLATLLLVPALAAWSPLRLEVLAPLSASSPQAGSKPPSTLPATSIDIGDVDPRVVGPESAAQPLHSSPITGAPTQGGAVSGDGFLRIADLLRGSIAGLPVLLVIWGIIALIISAVLARSAWVVRRIVRSAQPLDTRDWLDPLWEISDRFELEEPPLLLRSDRARMPFACGVFRPTIVLPAECDGWTLDRRRAVLLHELAHVRRRDLVGHTLGRAACALYWFHPLVWTAARNLRSESERACDDLALACGARPSDYAEHLLDIVTSVRRDSTPSVALAMARRKEFEGRMLAILDPELPRSRPTRWQSVPLIAGLAVLAVTIGAAAPAQRSGVRMPPAASRPLATPAAEFQQQARVDVAARSLPSGDSALSPERVEVTQALDEATAGEAAGSAAGKASVSAVGHAVGNAVSDAVASAVAGVVGPIVEGVVGSTMESLGNESKSPPRPLSPVAPPRGLDVKALLGRVAGDDRARLLANVLRTDTAAELRRVAAWGLSEHAEVPEAYQALAVAVRRDPDASVREMAAWALADAHEGIPTVVDALAGALRDSSPKVRATAAWALGNAGHTGAVPALAAALSDPTAAVRMRAAWALGHIDDIRHAPVQLIALLRDPDPRMREIAAWSLYRIEDPRSASALEAALRAETDRNMRMTYIRALASIGKNSVEAVRPLLESKDPAIRTMAIRALAGKGGGPWPWPWPAPRPYP